MRDLPSGTVTFLFTDVEGSTEVLTNEGRRGAPTSASLAEHHTIVDAAVVRLERTSRGGHAGRRARAAFSGATDAVTCCGTGPAAGDLAETPLCRFGSGFIRASRGLATSTGYVGLDVPRAPRESARPATAARCCCRSRRASSWRTSCPVGATLRDLGDHRLKDLSEPAEALAAARDLWLPDHLPFAADAREPPDEPAHPRRRR